MRRAALVLVQGVVAAGVAAAGPLVWPLSGTATPDPMNTSFGPRINGAQWDFHDGLDLPAPIGTPIRAVHAAIVHRAGPGGTNGYSSRHVVLRVDGVTGGPLYVVHLHLASIDGAISQGAAVLQGQPLGTVGDDDATYPHLHLEIRRQSPYEIASIHPLRYLPYGDTANFTAPTADRIQAFAAGTMVRFRFQAPDKNEGDLVRVEVDFLAGANVVETRAVELDDKATIHEGRGDRFAFRNDVAVEGYQTSNMAADGRTDVHYGILVRRLPVGGNGVRARAIDLGGHVAEGPVAALPLVAAFGDFQDFEDGLMPPAAWSVHQSGSGTGTTVTNEPASAWAGARGMRGEDLSTTEPSTQTASIARGIGQGRLLWVAEGWVRPDALGLAEGDNVYPLYFRRGVDLSVAATIRRKSGQHVAGIVTKEPDGSIGATIGTAPIATGAWRRTSLELQRLGTRETTAVLYLDGVEAVRRAWDGRTYEADAIRAGIGLSSVGATAVLSTDDVRLGDAGRLALPTFAPGAVPDGAAVVGTPLRVAKAGTSLLLQWGLSCNIGGPDYAVYEGTLGAFGATSPRACTTAGEAALILAPPAGSTFYLVVPRSPVREGSYGVDSQLQERPPSGAACAPQLLGSCGG